MSRGPSVLLRLGLVRPERPGGLARFQRCQAVLARALAAVAVLASARFIRVAVSCSSLLLMLGGVLLRIGGDCVVRDAAELAAPAHEHYDGGLNASA